MGPGLVGANVEVPLVTGASRGYREIDLRVTVNGKVVACRVAPLTPLADFLREDLGLTGVKLGCRAGDCGSCTVLVDGLPIVSCLTPVGKVDGRDVQTIEGLADDPRMRALRSAFRARNAAQCGYCIPGTLVACLPLLEAETMLTPESVIAGLAGNLCRCTGYEAIVEAVVQAASIHVKEGRSGA